jgi:hypothetical protein
MTASQRTRRRRSLAVVAVIALVAVAIAAGMLLLQQRPAPTPAAAAPPTQPILVSVSLGGTDVAHQGYPTNVVVRALGDHPIATLELWLSSRRLATATTEGGAPAQSARWTWTPADAGPAILVARATDSLGRQAQSAPLRVTVDAGPPLFRKVSQVEVRDGETAAEAAARVGGRADELATWNDGIDPAVPLSAGAVVFVPFDPAPVPRPETQEVVELAGAPVTWIAGGTNPVAADTIELASWSGAGSAIYQLAEGTGLFVPPEVTPSVSDCQITLAISTDATNATGLAVYGMGPTSATFSELATLAPTSSQSEITIPASGGAYLLDVSTYDGGTEQLGDLIAVDVPPDCAEPGWSGPAQLSGGFLVVEHAVDRAYLYLSQDGGPWTRVPSAAGTFVDAVDGKLDFSHDLPADVATTSVDIEAWGWSGTSLLDLGTGHKDAPASPPPAPVGGGGTNTVSSFDFTTLDWIGSKWVQGTSEFVEEPLYLRDGELEAWTSTGQVSPDLSRDFRWQSNGDTVDAVVWQVAAFPMAPEMAPDQPGVLLQQTLPVQEGTKTGVFPIDFRPIFAPPPEKLQIGDSQGLEVLGQITAASLGTPGSPAPAPTPAGTGGVVSQGSPATFSADWLLQSFTPSVLYVRAVAMDGTQVVGPVSNFVRFTVTQAGTALDPNAAPPTGPSPTNGPSATLRPYVLFLEFVPPANANPAFSECVMVTGIDVQKGGAFYGFELGDFYCEYTSTGGGWSLANAFNDFVDFVADAWDQIASAWSWLQSQLAAAIAKYSGCSAIAGGSFCEGMVKVGISIALTSVGIPPSLPNTQELMQMAKGELRDALVDVAGKSVESLLGFDPCDAAYLAGQGLGTTTCDDIADQLIDDLGAQLDAWKSSEAVATTGAPLLQGVNVVQHPWGQLRPPKFRVTIARNVNVPLPANTTCTMRLSMTSYVPNWTHSAYSELTGWGTVTENVSGPPFASLYKVIPDPASSDGAFQMPTTLPPDASVYQTILAALNEKVAITRDYYLTETNFWREPNNVTQIYVPGQGYTNTVDFKANRAWVLLQNGTVVNATVAPGPGSAGCFDPVIAYSVIPLHDLGYPCTPTYGAFWQTKDAPFSGDLATQIKCSIDYAKVSSW